jgi:hypothetical protein
MPTLTELHEPLRERHVRDIHGLAVFVAASSVCCDVQPTKCWPRPIV